MTLFACSLEMGGEWRGEDVIFVKLECLESLLGLFLDSNKVQG